MYNKIYNNSTGVIAAEIIQRKVLIFLPAMYSELLVSSRNRRECVPSIQSKLILFIHFILLPSEDR